MFVDLTRLDVGPDGLRLPELEYLQASDRLSGLADAFDEDHGRQVLAGPIENYEPECNLGCVVLEPDGRVYARNGMNPSMTPPEAARKRA